MGSEPADAMLALMMLCHGTRIGETRQARWSHISLAEGEWFIPAEHTKTGVEHHLPLTEQVRALLIQYRDTQTTRALTLPSGNWPSASGSPAGSPTSRLNARVDRKSTRLNSSHYQQSRMPSSA